MYRPPIYLLDEEQIRIRDANGNESLYGRVQIEPWNSGRTSHRGQFYQRRGWEPFGRSDEKVPARKKAFHEDLILELGKDEVKAVGTAIVKKYKQFEGREKVIAAALSTMISRAQREEGPISDGMILLLGGAASVELASGVLGFGERPAGGETEIPRGLDRLLEFFLGRPPAEEARVEPMSDAQAAALTATFVNLMQDFENGRLQMPEDDHGRSGGRRDEEPHDPRREGSGTQRASRRRTADDYDSRTTAGVAGSTASQYRGRNRGDEPAIYDDDAEDTRSRRSQAGSGSLRRRHHSVPPTSTRQQYTGSQAARPPGDRRDYSRRDRDPGGKGKGKDESYFGRK